MSQIINLDFFSLKKACRKFEQFRKNLTTEQEQIGAIQAFECTLEIAWKSMKRILIQEGFEVVTPKETVRKAFQVSLIQNP